MEFKGTKNKWECIGYDSQEDWVVAYFADDLMDITFIDISESEVKHNAELIAEAGNVRQQINCSLTELLEQRNESLECLKLILKYCGDVENENTQLKKTRPFVLSQSLINKMESK